MPIRIAIIGYGKIARDQHVPAILANPGFELVAVVSRSGARDAAVPSLPSHQALIEQMRGGIDAVAIATPPAARYAIARDALAAGLHVLLEKPPAATLGEIENLERLATGARRTLFTAWHAQHNEAVAAATRLVAGREVKALRIEWFEDVRKWHPGQEWIWAPGGFGVFDPGINALSIAARILPMPLFVKEATLFYPQNRQTPIAAGLAFVGEEGAFTAALDWRHAEEERWNIRIETGGGPTLDLVAGGATLLIDGERQPTAGAGEYPTVYACFAELIENGVSEVDREPLRIVADAFLVGRRELVERFD